MTKVLTVRLSVEGEGEEVEQSVKRLLQSLYTQDTFHGLQVTAASWIDVFQENASLWEVLMEVADYLDIDPRAAKKFSGNPAGVYIQAIKNVVGE
jgi:hypothetical protein